MPMPMQNSGESLILVLDFERAVVTFKLARKVRVPLRIAQPMAAGS